MIEKFKPKLVRQILIEQKFHTLAMACNCRELRGLKEFFGLFATNAGKLL